MLRVTDYACLGSWKAVAAGMQNARIGRAGLYDCYSGVWRAARAPGE